VEVRGLASELGPVLDLGIEGVVQNAEGVAGSGAEADHCRHTPRDLQVGSATRTVRSNRVNRPEANESAPAVQSSTTYSPGPSIRWLRYSSTAPVLAW
jgi:hypothetical protein